MKRNWKSAIAGMIILLLLQCMSVIFSTQTGYMSIAFTTPTALHTTTLPATISPSQVPATEASTLQFTATLPFTVTPESTITPIPSCFKHINGVAIKVNMTENAFLVKSSDPCLMMSSGGGSVGVPVIGERVEEDITLNFKTYHQYYLFTIPINSDKVSSKGILIDASVHWEIEKSEYGNFYWLDENYQIGKYWFLMKFVATATRTPNG